MGNNCIITYITSGYDKLIEPEYVTEGWDYVCFTDTPSVQTVENSVWDVYPILDEHMKIECPKRRGNAVVMQYPKYVPSEYDTCIFVDGNIRIQGDLNKFLESFNYDPKSHDFMIATHPDRDCIYDEAKAIVNLNKDTPLQVYKHVNAIREERYPPKYGLYQTNVMVVNNKSEKAAKIFDEWFTQYMRLQSKRDQMTLNFAIWKLEKFENLNANIIAHDMTAQNKNGKRFRSAYNTIFEVKPHVRYDKSNPVSKKPEPKRKYTAERFIEKRRRRKK